VQSALFKEAKVTTKGASNYATLIEAITKAISPELKDHMARYRKEMQKAIDETAGIRKTIQQCADFISQSAAIVSALRHVRVDYVGGAARVAAEWLQSVKRMEEEIVHELGQRKWVFTRTMLELPYDAIPHAVALERGGKRRAIFELFNYLYGPNSRIVEQLLQYWRCRPYMHQNQAVHLSNCIWALRHRRHSLVIPSIIPFVERQLTEIYFEMKGSPNYVEGLRVHNKPRFEALRKLVDDAGLDSEYRSEPLTVLARAFFKEVFYKNVDRLLGAPTDLSRHCIVHGSSFSYASCSNSIRAMMLAEVVLWWRELRLPESERTFPDIEFD